MKVKDIISVIEDLAPPVLQESYDNAGLLTGSMETEVTGVLITLDVTDEVLDEAIEKGMNLIVAHHPVIFKGLKNLRPEGMVERMVVKAVKNDLALYAVHTNLDNVYSGVNAKLGEVLELKNLRILSAGGARLKKIVVFCPEEHASKVRQAMFDAGAGFIGNYDSCSYNTLGEGTFKAREGANPYVGSVGKIHFEREVRIETVVPSHRLNRVISSMLSAHPYEEVAYDIYPLDNMYQGTGAGMIGELDEETGLIDYLKKVKSKLKAGVLRYNNVVERKIKKVAFCGGSGAFLIHDAYRAGADVFITADVKYHDFFEHSDEMTIVDAGHYETEQFTKALLYELLKENFPNFALQISETTTNPVLYL